MLLVVQSSEGNVFFYLSVDDEMGPEVVCYKSDINQNDLTTVLGLLLKVCNQEIELS
jgi:hypothetical protein